jgi:hypothetical protein
MTNQQRFSWPPRMRVELRCGEVSYYAAASLAPAVGERVPCMRHDYCPVTLVSRRGTASLRSGRTRRSRRSVEEMLHHLSDLDVQSVSQLRRSGFTLRLVETARIQGRVTVDDTGAAVLVKLACAAGRKDL